MSHWIFRLCWDTYQRRVSHALPEGHPSDEFSALLMLTRSQEMTKEQDRIFALLGLCADSLSITVDYGREAPELLRDVARRLMKSFPKSCQHCGLMCQSNEMFVLYQAEGSEARHDLPFWVPDWKASALISLWASQVEGCYRAAGLTRHQVSFTANPNHIKVTAKLCGRVIKMSEPALDGFTSQKIPMGRIDTLLLRKEEVFVFEHHAAGLSRLTQMFQWIGSNLDLSADCYAYEGPYRKRIAFWRTLCENIVQAWLGSTSHLTRIPTDLQTERQYDERFRELLNWIIRLKTMIQAGNWRSCSRICPSHGKRALWLAVYGLASAVVNTQAVRDRYGTTRPGPLKDVEG